MNILLIEDNQLKRDKIINFLSENFQATLTSAASYNSGLNSFLSGQFDFLILDMSMPTFDRTELSHGGRFRAQAGKEIAIKLAKQKRLISFVVLTGYRDFGESVTIEEIDESLRSFGDAYKGWILFDAAESVWKDQLSEIISGSYS